MRELDCDFCGETAAGAYEVLPADLDPTPDEQVRVVLCAGCRETLDGVLAPLLDRLGARDEGGVDPSFADDAAGHAPPEARSTDDGVDETGDDPGLSADAAGHAPPPADTDEGATGSASTDAAAVDEDAGGADGGTDDDAATHAGGATDTDPAAGREEPEGFRKVMRFCNNREFPMDRAEVSEFAAGAYGLDDDEVAEIFDYAIDRGILVEEGGRLTKG